MVERDTTIGEDHLPRKKVSNICRWKNPRRFPRRLRGKIVRKTTEGKIIREVIERRKTAREKRIERGRRIEEEKKTGGRRMKDERRKRRKTVTVEEIGKRRRDLWAGETLRIIGGTEGREGEEVAAVVSMYLEMSVRNEIKICKFNNRRRRLCNINAENTTALAVDGRGVAEVR